MVERTKIRRLVVMGIAALMLVPLVAESAGPKKPKPAAQKPAAKKKPAAKSSPPSKPEGPRKPESGVCVNDVTSTSACGGLGETCESNICSCKRDYARCTPDAKDCTQITVDDQNCGGCGIKCKDNQMCENGKCNVIVCDKGDTLCPDGCRNLREDDHDCGKCGRECTSGMACINGACRF